MDKYSAVTHTIKYYSVKRNEVPMHATTQLNPEIMICESIIVTLECVLYDLTFINSPE